MSHLEDDDLLKTQTPGAAGLIAGRYKVIRQLGRGGMGEVFLVQDAVSGVQFALKRIPEDLVRSSAEMEDIRATYSLVCNLSHPHIANYKHLERDPESGSYYLIMEYVDGLSLDRWVKKNGPMTESQALKMLSGLASALDFAHSHRVIHRDVKASNIIVYGDCEAKLIDFGLAAQIKSSLTRRSVLDPGEQVKGTRPYMAPELWRGKKAMESADQWALAATIYEAVTGDPPWLSDDMAILGACITNDEPDRPEGISDALWVALERGLAKDPKARWSNCAEFAQAASGQIKVTGAVKSSPATLAISSAEADRLADEFAKLESEARARAAREAREKKEKEEVASRQAELEEQIRQEQERRRAAEAEAAAERKRREAERTRAEAAERRRREQEEQSRAEENRRARSSTSSVDRGKASIPVDKEHSYAIAVPRRRFGNGVYGLIGAVLICLPVSLLFALIFFLSDEIYNDPDGFWLLVIAAGCLMPIFWNLIPREKGYVCSNCREWISEHIPWPRGVAIRRCAKCGAQFSNFIPS